jgi:hypothetical protein
MSHFTRMRTALRDPDVLAAALRAVGYPQAEVHEQPQVMFGYRGDARPERAEVIVRREHIGRASNDIGFARRPDGTFEAIISGFDRGRHDERWLARLTQAYGHAAALKYAADHGYDVVADEVEQDGAAADPAPVRLTPPAVGLLGSVLGRIPQAEAAQ